MPAWQKFNQDFVENLKTKTTDEALKDPAWAGNMCLLTPSSVKGDLTFCIWRLPVGSTTEDCQKYVDNFTAPSGPAVKNLVWPIEGSMGIQNLAFETYLRDWIQLGKTGALKGPAVNGDFFFVHHHIQDKAAWDSMFGEKLGLIKGKSTTQDVSEAWEVGKAEGAMWCGLGDEDAVCMWVMPQGSTESDFQSLIDTFTGSPAKNEVFKLDLNMSANLRCMHPDFYTQEAIAYANAS